MKGRPGLLRCPMCVRRAQRQHHLMLEAIKNITRTGRTGPFKGHFKYRRVEVKHETCGHVWLTTYFGDYLTTQDD